MSNFKFAFRGNENGPRAKFAEPTDKLQEQLREIFQKELADAKREAKVARSAFNRLHTDAKADHAIMSDEQAYNEATQLQLRLDESVKETSEARARYKELEAKLKDKETEISDKSGQLHEQAHKLGTTRVSLSAALQQVEDAKLQDQNNADLLSKAYADADTLRSDLKSVRDDKDRVERDHRDTQLQLSSLRTQWEEDQAKIERLEGLENDLRNLDEHSRGLEEDVTNVTEQVSDRDRLIGVKDARIQHLENQLQRAIAGQLAAESARNSLQSPTADPPVTTTALADSLQSELAELEDREEDIEFEGPQSEFEEQHLDFSGELESASISIAPIEPRVAITSTATQTDIVPESSTATAFVQTDAPPQLVSTSVQTVTEFLGTSRISSIYTTPFEPRTNFHLSGITAIDTPPVMARSDATSSAIGSQTPADVTTLGASRITAVDIAPNEIEHPTAVIDPKTRDVRPIGDDTIEVPQVERIQSVSQPDSLSTIKYIIIAVLVALCAYCYYQWQAWESANSLYPTSAGAYGSPRYLFGVFPIGFDIGESQFSETIARTMAGAIHRAEDALGVHGSISH